MAKLIIKKTPKAKTVSGSTIDPAHKDDFVKVSNKFYPGRKKLRIKKNCHE